MKTTVRRRLALAGLATSVAVVAGVLAAPGATAAPITEVTPSTVVNTSASQALTFRNPTPLVGGDVVLTRTGAAGDTITTRFVQSAPGTSTTPQPVNFADGGSTRATDGPANAGTYDAVLRNAGGQSDSCTGCFVVASPGAPTVSAVSVSGLGQGASGNVTVTGTNFARGSVLQVLRPDGSVDPDVSVNGNPVDPDQTAAGGSAETTNGNTTSTTLRRRFVVAPEAATGPRRLRVVNTDATSEPCTGSCFAVDGAPLTGVTPPGGSNNPSPATPTVTVSFRGQGLRTGTPNLSYVADPGSATRSDLSIVGTGVRFADDGTSVTADFDLRNAAPGQDAYQPVLTQSDSSVNACTCRFDVVQTSARAVTAVSPATVAAGATQTVSVTGTGFSRGVRVNVSGADVTTTAVRFVSPTRVDAVVAVAAGAVNGPRDVTSVTTEGTAGTPCAGCFGVTGGRSATASPSPTATTSPAAPSRPATPTVSVSPSTITASQRSTVAGTAEPGTTVEVLAYSRPRTDYVVVRSGTVGPDGRYSFLVGPSGNTRLYARTVTDDGTVDSPSTVLTVRTSINLKVTRTGVRTYRFTGSTLPKRPGQTVNVRYRSGGRTVVASTVRVAPNGRYDVTRRFAGGGTFDLFTDTGVDLNNAAGRSNVVRTTLR